MMNTIKLLLIEDEKPIHKLMKVALRDDEYDITSAFTADEGIKMAAITQPDIVILDLGLPQKTGFDVILSIREWNKRVPILVLSARDDDQSKVKTLDDGANDYVTKPFSMFELLARIRALLRTSSDVVLERGELKVGPFLLDIPGHLVQKNGKELHLTPIEFNLFSILLKNANRVILHKQLLKEGWGLQFGADIQYLRVFMKQLRQKIEDVPSQPSFIVTEPGVGYKFRACDALLPSKQGD